uniref:Ig-like domain-containing protein n=1 Tax=Plectus sambesii TaxID=2011161 RepID=A0A914X5T4_9BILA
MRDSLLLVTLICLLCLTLSAQPSTAINSPTLTSSPGNKRRHDKSRQRRDELISPPRKLRESFSLRCPHVADSSNADVRIVVTWTRNDAIWLKVDDGQRRINNRLTTFSSHTISGKTVMRVTLNKGRYQFNYDELTGDFAMEISPVLQDDDGLWQCHVVVHRQQGNAQSLTSRSRVQAIDASTTFSRSEHGTVEIYRTPDEYAQAEKEIVFDRRSSSSIDHMHDSAPRHGRSRYRQPNKSVSLSSNRSTVGLLSLLLCLLISVLSMWSM